MKSTRGKAAKVVKPEMDRKKPYVAPRIVLYGTFEKLTRDMGKNPGPSDDFNACVPIS